MNPTAVELDPGVEERVNALIEAGRPADCVALSEVDALVQDLDLSQEEADAVHERIESSGLAIEGGDLQAKERLINANLRPVGSNARRYMRQDLNLLDLIQEGIFGVIRAS